jgi:26S proteasome regulatory subunit N10
MSIFFYKGSTEDDLLQQALALSLTQQDDGKSSVSRPRDLSSMTEEEQLHYALQMSMAASATPGSTSTELTEKPASVDAEMKDVCQNQFLLDLPKYPITSKHFFFKDEEDYDKAMNDPEFLQRVISSLPGVDPNSSAVREAFDNLTKDNKDGKDKDQKEEKK